MTEFPLYSITYGLSCWILGLGSFIFHAHETRITQWIDVAGMYLGLSVVVAYSSLMLVSVDLPMKYQWKYRTISLLSFFIMGFMLFYYKWEINSTKVIIGQIVVIALVIICVITIRVEMFRCTKKKYDKYYFLHMLTGRVSNGRCFPLL